MPDETLLNTSILDLFIDFPIPEWLKCEVETVEVQRGEEGGTPNEQ